LILPTTEKIDYLRRDDDWQKAEAESFSIKKIRQYFACCAPLSAQGLRPREHMWWGFNDVDEMFYDLIALSSSFLTLKVIFTKGICQKLLEANSLRSKSPTTASDLLSLARLGGGHQPPFP